MDCGSSIILLDLPSQLALAQMVERETVVFAIDAKSCYLRLLSCVVVFLQQPTATRPYLQDLLLGNGKKCAAVHSSHLMCD